MTIYLRQSTASQEVPLGYFLDSTDGDTAETGLTIANTDIQVWKTGATSLANKNSGGATHMAGGIYYATLDATDTNTIGPLVLFVHVSGALACKVDCVVLDEAVYDVVFGTTAPSTYAGGAVASVTGAVGSVTGAVGSVTGNVGGNVVGSVGSVTGAVGSVTTVSDKTGYSLAADQAVNATKIGGTTQTGRDLGASVLISPGTGTGQLDVTSGVIKANLAQILGTALTETSGYIAAAFKQFFNVASPTGTMKAITNVVTTTNLTNLPAAAATAAELAKVPKSDGSVSWNATALAAINAEVDTALNTAIPGSPTADSINERLVAIDAYGAPPTAAAVRSEMDSNSTKLANLDATVSSRLAAASYTAPLDAAGTRTALGMASADLDTQLDALPTDADVQTAAAAALTAYDPPTKGELDSGLAGLNDLSAAAVNAEVDTALADYDPPTYTQLLNLIRLLARGDAALQTDLASVLTEINANLGSGAGGYDNNADSLQTIVTGWLTTVYGQLATALSYIGSPSNLGSGASLAKNMVDIEAQTDDIGAAGAGLTALGDTRLANLDATVSSRLATASYTAPLDAAGTRTAVGLATANLDTQLAALPTDADVQTAATAALNAYDPPTKAELDSGLAGLNDPTAAAVADAVWDEAIAGHAGVGSTGEALTAAGSAGDPWATALPGAYGSGTAGKIIGDNINATVSSRASQTSVDDLPTNAELASALASADDATLAAIGALNNLSSAQAQTAAAAALTAYDPPTKAELDSAVAPLATAAALATVDGIVDDILVDTGTTLPGTLATIAGYVDTEVAAIKAKTDNLPASPAAVGSAMTLTAAYDAAKTAATQTSVDDLPTNAELAAAVGPLATASSIAALNDLDSTEVQAAAAAALAAYDPPTKTEMDNGLAALNDLDATAVQAAAAAALAAYDPPTKAEMDSAVAPLATAAALDAVDNYVDTEVAAIKAVTDKLDTTLVQDGGVYDFTAAALAAAPSSSGGDATAANQAAILAALADVPTDVDTELTASHGAGVWGAAGSGLLTDTITVNDGTDPLDGVLVQVATDSNFSNIIRSGYTNGLGQVTFHYDAAGTYYGRAEIATFNVLTFEITVS